MLRHRAALATKTFPSKGVVRDVPGRVNSSFAPSPEHPKNPGYLNKHPRASRTLVESPLRIGRWGFSFGAEKGGRYDQFSGSSTRHGPDDRGNVDARYLDPADLVITLDFTFTFC